MRSLLFLALALFPSAYCLGQKTVFSDVRTYKVEGYILVGKDTIPGYIAIPIDRDEVDYSSLTKRVTFIDSLKKLKKYKPDELAGFGVEKDDVLSHYISFAKPGSSSKNVFLKKVVEGKVMLLVEKIDQAAGYSNMSFYGTGTSNLYQKEINRSIYYIKIGEDEMVKVPFDKRTASIGKRELKRLLTNLPDSFSSSDEQVDFSSFITLLESYNAELSNKD